MSTGDIHSNCRSANIFNLYDYNQIHLDPLLSHYSLEEVINYTAHCPSSVITVRYFLSCPTHWHKPLS